MLHTVAKKLKKKKSNLLCRSFSYWLPWQVRVFSVSGVQRLEMSFHSPIIRWYLVCLDIEPNKDGDKNRPPFPQKENDLAWHAYWVHWAKENLKAFPLRGAPLRTNIKQWEDSVCEIPTAVPYSLDKIRVLFPNCCLLPIVFRFVQGQKASPDQSIVLCCAFCGDWY